MAEMALHSLSAVSSTVQIPGICSKQENTVGVKQVSNSWKK